MDPESRHQCFVYGGPPSHYLSALAATARKMLQLKRQCLYLNSKPLIAGFCSYLAAEGVDVEQAVQTGALVLSADQNHLVDGRFDVDQLMRTLETTLNKALEKGFSGLWASGDMTWEFGPEKDFSKLVEYECRLEEFMRTHPELCGICQYHVETLPAEVVRHGLQLHESIFINETLSLMNSHYAGTSLPAEPEPASPVLDGFVRRILDLQQNNSGENLGLQTT